MRPSLPRLLRHDLGGYREYEPPLLLTPFVEAIWTYRTPSDSPFRGGATHRVLPDPALNLAFCCYRDGEGYPLDPEILVIGPKTSPHVVTFGYGYEMVAVKLKLEWVGPLLGLRPSEHADALEDFMPAHPLFARPLFDALVETRTAAQAGAVLAAALAETVLKESGPPPGAVAHALDLVRLSNGRLSIDGVAHRVGLSERHLRRVVNEATGTSLKVYARTVRFLHVMLTADRTPDPPWAALALDAGYCDQSHLVRESQALCGMPPGQLYRERRAEAEMSKTR